MSLYSENTLDIEAGVSGGKCCDDYMVLQFGSRKYFLFS